MKFVIFVQYYGRLETTWEGMLLNAFKIVLSLLQNWMVVTKEMPICSQILIVIYIYWNHVIISEML